MIVVSKGNEPEGLKVLREECKAAGLSPKASFEMLRKPLKDEVIDCLKRDQGQLCVYCMSRIPRDDKDLGIPGQTIEHLIPVDPEDGRDVGQGLDYRNLFAVCHGNTKRREKGSRRHNTMESLTCDKHRGNIEFRKIDPCDASVLKTIYYSMDGEIYSSDPDVAFDLQNTLNLNSKYSPIVSERKATLDALIDEIGTIDPNSLLQHCEELLDAFSNETEIKTPYVGILIWYLRSLIDPNSVE